MGETKLAVISDTAVTFREDGTYLGYEPVVKELEYFSPYFTQLTWMASLHGKSHTVYSGALPEDWKIVAMASIGDKGMNAKLKIIAEFPKIVLQVYKLIKESTHIHVRAPSHVSFAAIFISSFFRKKRFWFKYAGSWVDKAPFSYRLQRVLLNLVAGRNTFVSVNGNWEGYGPNIVTLENPCFSKAQYDLIGNLKYYEENTRGLRLVYVGSLSEFKGVHLIIDALKQIGFSGYNSFTIIGEGDYSQELRNRANGNPKFRFLGSLTKNEVFEELLAADALIIASATEGFPKVLAEGMMCGCIPISTDVSCIAQYILEDFGYLIPERSVDGIAATLKRLVNDSLITEKKRLCHTNAAIFTYESYESKLKSFFLPEANIY